MKRTILVAAIATTLLSANTITSAQAADEQVNQKEVKKGWTFGALPCATYSNDMGFQYGAFGDVYYYGDGKTYPDPLHKISWEASHFTKGRSRFHLAYDSKYLVPKVRITCSATYVNDPLYNFYGFNGAASPLYNEIRSNKDYLGQVLDGTISASDAAMYAVMCATPGLNYGTSYYHMKRDMVRILAGVQGVITPNLRWAGGLSFWNFRMGDMNTKYGYDPQATIYQHYKQYGVIKEEEANGGNRLEMKGGIVYDTRDIEAAPNKGIWAELYLNGSPDIFGDGMNYLRLCAHLRQYISIPLGFIKAGDPVFAYHLAYQGTIAGEAPFYMQQDITTLILKQMLSEGLGSSNTIRGTHNSRMIGDGYAWGNFELRVKLVNFKLFGQYFYIATNPFFDCGMIVQPYRVSEMAALPEMQAAAFAAGYQLSSTEKYIKDMAGEFISTAGIGLKLAWNQNFIISTEVAHNFNKGLGDPLWISIGTNYNF